MSRTLPRATSVRLGKSVSSSALNARWPSCQFRATRAPSAGHGPANQTGSDDFGLSKIPRENDDDVWLKFRLCDSRSALSTTHSGVTVARSPSGNHHVQPLRDCFLIFQKRCPQRTALLAVGRRLRCRESHAHAV